ncbi:MAG: hypothetical protein ACNYPH_05840 [Gammaproteobacteria bacterium WSBS_2016_MAG_OTU1]
MAVVKKGRGYGIKEVLYVAYCFLTDEKPNKDRQFTEAQLKLLNEAMFAANGSKWVSHTGRNHLINLEFKVRDYENVLLLNISQTYKEGIAENELYEATRGVRVGDINRAESINMRLRLLSMWFEKFMKLIVGISQEQLNMKLAI